MCHKLTLTIILALVALALPTPVTFTHALATLIVSDDFNDNSIDTAKWDPNNLVFGPTNTNVSIAESGHTLRIGPLLQNVNGFNYRGIRTINTYNFNDAYAYVELVQAPASNTNAEAAFEVCSDPVDCYRLSVLGGNLIGVLRMGAGRGAAETTLFSIPYDSTNHRFLRIRNDLGSLYMDTAPVSGGLPATWTQQYSESWNASITTSAIIFELKGGTFQAESSPPGKVIFDNFEAATP